MPEVAAVVVAVDGPAAAGKGTLARRLATRFDYAFLDTGGLYRAAALKLIEGGGDPADAMAAETAARQVTAAMLDDPRLRREAVAQAASRVASLPGVRHALLDFQRSFARCPPDGLAGAVLDGRDIGTVVCPDAMLKLFVTASPEIRAGRRAKELRARGVAAIYGAVLKDMTDRDARDSLRASAPLTIASDAIVIDTTELDADEVLERASGLLTRKLADV